MKYAPRKVYIKENNVYVELAYKDYCHRREADQSYVDKLFIPVQGCLLEVVREQYADFYKDKERWRYLKKLDTNHSLLSLEGFTDGEGNVIDFIADEEVDVVETVVHAVMMDRLKTALSLLSVKSAKRARFLDGMYISTSAPYGYKKDPADRQRLVIDERYAPTVRMIFSLAKDGLGILQIRNYINSRHILRPSAVNPNGYGRYFNGEDDPKRYEWSNNSVRGILRNPVYAGHLVMGKRVRPSFKSHKSFSVLPENYKVVRDVHQPIVDLEDFELVQRMITSRRSNKNKPRRLDNIFAGLIKCADCGYAMTLAKANRSPKEEVIDEYGYMCNNYKTFGKSVDTSHWIEARQLYDCVLADIRKHAAEALADNDELCRKLAGQIGLSEAECQGLLTFFQGCRQTGQIPSSSWFR